MYYSNTKHIICCQAIYPEACNTVALNTLKSVKLLIFALPLGMDQWVHYARYTNSILDKLPRNLQRQKDKTDIGRERGKQLRALNPPSSPRAQQLKDQQWCQQS